MNRAHGKARVAGAAKIVILGMLACAASATTAAAADRFGVVGIENATQVTIRMQHRWGDGTWKADVIPPGTRKHYWWTYAVQNQDKSPPFHVKFDSDLSKGTFFEKYDLKKNACPDHTWECSHKHVFRYDGGKTFIELYQKK